MSTAICLSGGGAKGDFQLGALTLLYERGIRPEVICATSVGSVNAIKLAEGEDPVHPERGLSGLVGQWESLQRDGDMYTEEAWLYDPQMDPRVRDGLTGRAWSLGISGPQHSDGRCGDLEPVINFFIDAGWLASDGAALLRSLELVSRARSLYNLNPIRARLGTELNRDAIAAWAAAGGQLRMGTVALESGKLRYVTETGAVVERDGSPVMGPDGLTPACADKLNKVAEAEDELLSLQEELRDGFDQPGTAIKVRAAQRVLRDARQAFQNCVDAQPPVPLFVDLADGVLASAAIPAIFQPCQLGDEWYVDGGVRELLPVQIAVDLGATEIYALSAGRMDVARAGSFTRAGMFDILARSVEDLLLSEIGEGDLRVDPTTAGGGRTVHVIAPDVEIHGVTTIDPGLIQINRDYGYMRAADVLDGVPHSDRRWALSTQIAQRRLDVWSLENRRFGHLDPTRLPDGTPPTDPTLQSSIDAGKATLRQLVGERRSLRGVVPPGIDWWTTASELHPWASRWLDVGHANDVIAMAAANGHLYAVTSDSTLWIREAATHEVGWTPIGQAVAVTALAATNGHLYCATTDNRLWTRAATPVSMDWTAIGDANAVVAMAAIDGTLYCATSDDKLWTRPAQATAATWSEHGHANDLTAMASSPAKLFCTTTDRRLWQRNAQLPNVDWQAVDTALDTRGLAATPQAVFAATSANRLVARPLP